MSVKSVSLEERHVDKFVNEVFKDNILLNIAYMKDEIARDKDIEWDKVRKPFKYKFTLAPNKTFAFHDDVYPQFKSSLVKTSNANFNFDDGFRSSGYLVGDGVCHLASLLYWVAKTAGLEVYAPTNHNFANIPEISKEYGVSIYKMPGATFENARQNLYVTNNRALPVVFEFDYDGKILKLFVSEAAEG